MQFYKFSPLNVRTPYMDMLTSQTLEIEIAACFNQVDLARRRPVAVAVPARQHPDRCKHTSRVPSRRRTHARRFNSTVNALTRSMRSCGYPARASRLWGGARGPRPCRT